MHWRNRRRVRRRTSGRSFVYNPRFPGQYYDAETGLNYNYHRDYDPAVGRYIESDPILQPTRAVIDGKWIFAVPYLLKRIRLLLPYAYVADQPTAGNDPRGGGRCRTLTYDLQRVTGEKPCQGT
jgi:RHS repeat-associated protein